MAYIRKNRMLVIFLVAFSETFDGDTILLIACLLGTLEGLLSTNIFTTAVKYLYLITSTSFGGSEVEGCADVPESRDLPQNLNPSASM